ncbi:MAG: hypothetical protein QME62_00035 [Armatimonadota bacterium]|nr:hypothetical protein [Armatimonadota bacterium]
MKFDHKDKQILRELAGKVAEIAAHPRQAELREMWKRHNRLEKIKPMVLVYPECSWMEILPDSDLQCTDELARKYEKQLRQRIYYWEHLRDDSVQEPWVKVDLCWWTTGWGITPSTIPSPIERGAWAFNPPIKEESDIEKLRFPDLVIDEEKTQSNFEALHDAIGDILEVKIHRRIFAWNFTGLANIFIYLRGLDQMMWDMVERPEWLHRVMSFLAEGNMRLLDQVEAYDKLDLVNTDDYVGSGGLAYTDELPGPGFQGRVRLCDLWGFAEAQELVGVSPQMHEEFVFQYQRPLVERFGLNCYGCCEPVTDRLDYVFKFARMRRISISPWADRRIAAEKLQDKYIYSWKPNPAHLVGGFNADFIRKYIRETLEIAKDCILEIILKDVHTVEHHPERLWEWVRIAQEETGGF